ncbi:hypothetical protein Taro_055409 [Colocasia esculenta]|uniref:Chromosome transmission fidelity protein 8 n=1 Tax=Colocasia esculenta TaxID=4460 RepID=A0A843XQX2_COLES|nr:hypothetical protein [Colocasia esculenta]
MPDGVDVISISLLLGQAEPYELTAIATFDTMEKGIFVSTISRNFDPSPKSIGRRKHDRPPLPQQDRPRYGAGDCPDWAIVKLKGVVEVHPSVGNQIQNLEIGSLYCTSQANYTFTVGYHELSGTKMPLKKPLLVLRKRKEELNGAPPPKTELEVIRIIRHRILFKSRPKPLISKPQTKDKRPG